MSTRKQIRSDVVARLKAAIAEVSNRVYPSRAEALGDLDLPCICVYTRDEDVETIDSRPTHQDRSLALAIEIIVAGSESIDDDLDDLAEKIEAELLDSLKVSPQSGLYRSVALTRTEMGFVDSGRKPVGAARLTFDFGYEKTFT